jgi:hypothetical protein
MLGRGKSSRNLQTIPLNLCLHATLCMHGVKLLEGKLNVADDVADVC